MTIKLKFPPIRNTKVDIAEIKTGRKLLQIYVIIIKSEIEKVFTGWQIINKSEKKDHSNIVPIKINLIAL